MLTVCEAAAAGKFPVATRFKRYLYLRGIVSFGNRNCDTRFYPPPGVCRTVLIVDDNEPTARALAKVLSAAQFDTAVAFRGSEAVE